MNTHHISPLVLLALCCVEAAWGATSNPIDCPATLQIETHTTPPAGWQPVPALIPPRLERIGFFSGPPEEQAALVPNEFRRGKGEEKDVWRFSPPPKEGVWVACYYSGTLVGIARRLEDGNHTCWARYRSTRTGNRLDLIEARCEQP